MTERDLEVNPTTERIIRLCAQRKRIWSISTFAIILSCIGLFLSFINPSIKAPLKPGLDFTGGTQIKLERVCSTECTSITSEKISNYLTQVPVTEVSNSSPLNVSQARVQLLDDSRFIVLRLPFLNALQSKYIIESVGKLAGPFKEGGTSIDTIGPSLGGKLLRSSLISLFVAFSGIAVYISIRYDRKYAFLALVALAHDVIIVCGIFSWLGLVKGVEVDSLFAVALLTIAGYSVNDTVVVFDRIRELTFSRPSMTVSDQIDRAVSATLTRTLYTSGTTLLPLIALIFFGGQTLYWFAVALAIGVLIGSWSSIALAPSLLSFIANNQTIKLIE